MTTCHIPHSPSDLRVPKCFYHLKQILNIQISTTDLPSFGQVIFNSEVNLLKLFIFENSSNLSLPKVAGPSISFFVVSFEVYYGAQLASSLQLAAWSNANVEAEDSGHPEAHTCMGCWFC